MRDRSLLPMMEQLIMLVVFALSAVLCVQAFVLADRTSRQCEERDRAMVEAQNAAEKIKSVRGDLSLAAACYGGTENGLMWGWSLDEDWQEAQEDLTYHVLVTPLETENPLLGSAEVTIYGEEGQTLAALPVAWQEVDSHA